MTGSRSSSLLYQIQLASLSRITDAKFTLERESPCLLTFIESRDRAVILDDRLESLLDGIIVSSIQRCFESARVQVAFIKHDSDVIQLTPGIERPEHRNESLHNEDRQVVQVAIGIVAEDGSLDIDIIL